MGHIGPAPGLSVEDGPLVPSFWARYRPPFFCHRAKTGPKQSRALRTSAAARCIEALACCISGWASAAKSFRRACSYRLPAWVISGRASSNRSQQSPNSGAAGACRRQSASRVHDPVRAMEYAWRAFSASRRTSSKQTTGSVFATLPGLVWPKASVVGRIMPMTADTSNRMREFKMICPTEVPRVPEILALGALPRLEPWFKGGADVAFGYPRGRTRRARPGTRVVVRDAVPRVRLQLHFERAARLVEPEHLPATAHDVAPPVRRDRRGVTELPVNGRWCRHLARHSPFSQNSRGTLS
jgi:hypothetical protein